MKAGQNAYRDRRLKKRTFHQLWVLRINAACREHEIRYSRFIYGLELAGIEINRKMLSELAISEPETFKQIVDAAKAALPAEGQAPDLEALKKKWGVKTEKGTTKPTPSKSEEKTEEKVEKEEGEVKAEVKEVKVKKAAGEEEEVTA